MQIKDAGWSLEIKTESWVEDTENQVDFIIKTLQLTGRERILDMACGFGRHALSLARRGYSVTGIDFTKAFIDDAIQNAERASLSIEFIHADIRTLKLNNEFDVVLNLADGAIGYFDSEEENLHTFDVISSALKKGGKHFMDICNAEHAEQFFPKRHWDVGKNKLSLPEFDWDAQRRRMLFTDWNITFGEIAIRPEKIVKDTQGVRLYSRTEVGEILRQRNMRILQTFSNYYGAEETDKEMQLIVYSEKI